LQQYGRNQGRSANDGNRDVLLGNRFHSGFVTRFGCMKRRQGELFPHSLTWHVHGGKDPERDE